MKLFKSKIERLEEQSCEKYKRAWNAFSRRLEMLNKLEQTDNWFERWQYVYYEVTTTDLILLVIIKLFFGDAPERPDND